MYDPGRDAALRYPDWVIRHRPLSHGIPEVMCRRRKVILVERADDWIEKRWSLTHAVCHLDLRHSGDTAGLFDRDQEEAAEQLAARRLISIDLLIDVLSWTRLDMEIADELQVPLAGLELRKKHFHPSELAQLRRSVRYLEETA